MEELKKYFTEQKILDHILEIKSKLSANISEEANLHIFNSIKKKNKLLKEISKQDNGDISLTYLSIYNHCVEFCELCLSTLDYFSKLEISDASETFKIETQQQITKVSALLNKFIREFDQSDIINDLSDKIIPELKEIEDFKYFQSIFHINQLSLPLYATVMQKCILSMDKQLVFKILNLIEEDKDKVLSGYATSTFNNSRIHKINPPLKRFGLIPQTKLLPVKELFSQILQGLPPTTSADFKVVSRKINIGFILMYHTVYTPIEYNISSLILPSNQPIQSDEYGPTAQMVERFKTMMSYPRVKKWNFSYEVIGPKSDKFFVLESLDGKLFRALAPWLQSTVYYLPRYRLEFLLNYITTDNKPTRISNYQSIAAKSIARNMFLRKPLEVDGYVEQVSIVPSHIIRQDVSFKLQLLVDKIIEDEFSTLTTVAQLNKIIHDGRLYDLFYDCILGLYDKAVSIKDLKDSHAGRFRFSELYSSFLVSLQQTANRFMKELHDGYGREPLDKKVLSLPEKELSKELRDKITKVIDMALILVIKNSDNLYSSLHLKYLILNFE